MNDQKRSRKREIAGYDFTLPLEFTDSSQITNHCVIYGHSRSIQTSSMWTESISEEEQEFYQESMKNNRMENGRLQVIIFTLPSIQFHQKLHRPPAIA